MKKENVKAYIAGIVDADGCVALRKDKKIYLYPQVVVSNTHLPLLKMLQKRYNGSITKLKRRKENHTQAYNWRVTTDQARILLRDIIPYMIIKKKKAKIVLKYDNKKLIEKRWKKT